LREFRLDRMCAATATREEAPRRVVGPPAKLPADVPVERLSLPTGAASTAGKAAKCGQDAVRVC
jgi:hypothetical protein